ncbi:MAG: thioredoxin domain-containing protein [Flavobacteriaceae bacterium]|nr:thioredoxin domain-containing protein [Flavobacteriaceae bacterium]
MFKSHPLLPNQWFILIVMISIFFSCAQENTLTQNNLEHETSPYLLQHAKNPVFWQRWDREVYDRQNTQKKLLVVSIGYSSCHWCHVMEKETFEDQEVADFMNESFISIKVDREENPEIDNIYITATQMMTGSGGWPLNVVCLPDGRPVYGGTYHTKAQWLEVLGKIQKLYENDKNQLEEFADRVEKGIQEVNTFEIYPEPKLISPSLLVNEMDYWMRAWDLKWGGEKRSQKFITPVKFNYIQQYQKLTGDEKIKAYFENSLQTIANSGVFDPLEGGFFRYTVDPHWNIPHFEKMLYDNAQILGLYSNAYKQTKNSVFKERVYQTFSFLKERMSNPDGGYYAAIDADNNEGEGRYYVFTKESVQAAADEDFDLLVAYFNIDLNEPFEEHFYNLKLSSFDTAFLEQHKIDKETLEAKKETWISKLKVEMQQREFPLIDTKIITSWNALLIVGLTQAYEAFGDPQFINEAESIYSFLKENTYKKRHFFHTFQEGKPKIDGFLEDYAFMTQAAIALYKTSGNKIFLEDALAFNAIVLKEFKDDASPFFTFTKDPTLFTKIVGVDDNVIPSANAVMAENLWILGQWTGEESYSRQAQEMLQGVLPYFSEGRSSDYTQWSQLLAMEAYPYYEVVIVGPEAKTKTIEFQKEYYPNVVFQTTTLASDLPLLKDRFFEGETYVYVCQNRVCLRPVESVKEAIEQMENWEN